MINAPLPLCKNRINLGLTKSGLGVSAAIESLLETRLKEAEAQFFGSPIVKNWQAKREHLFMEHGTSELCQCPDWKDQAPIEL